MFRFEDPTYLYFLLLIPLLALIRFAMVKQQKRRLRKFGDRELLANLMPDVSRWRPRVKFWLLMTALALLIIMWARPQMGTRISQEKRTGIEVIIALDISNSMLAEDVAPSRLERSKMMVENLVDHFTNDKIGLVVFAGNAFVQLPITSDYVSAKMFLNSINPSLIASQGTDIAGALNTAMYSFTQQTGVGKAIIVITDGEDHEGGALEAAHEAHEKGMNVFVLGVGSTQGAPIPIEGNDYLRDNEGNTVISALNENMCRQVAEAGSGAYIHVENDGRAQELLNNELDKLSKKEIASMIYSDFDEQFQAIGVLVLLLLIIEVCILERKNSLLKQVSLFKRSSGENLMKLTLLILISQISFTTTMVAQTDRKLIRQGNKQFRKGNTEEAEVAYRKALEKNPRNPQANYNLGSALFVQRKDSAAVQQLENAAKLEMPPMRKAEVYHNIGVVCQSHQMFGEAIEAYKAALRLNPDNDKTRYNLELCKRQQQQGKDKKNQKDQKQDKKQDKKDNNQDKDKNQDKNQDKEKEQQQQQQDKNKMDKETAEQLLKAAMQEEKNTQQRMKKAMQQPSNRKLQKNW